MLTLIGYTSVILASYEVSRPKPIDPYARRTTFGTLLPTVIS